MESPPRVAVVGAGAVGGFFGGMLARSGARVTLIGRPGPPGPHLQAIARDGLFIDGVKIREKIAVHASQRIEDAKGAGLVLFCVKTVDTDSAARSLAPHLEDGTIVVSLQNGIDNVDRMRAAGVDAIPAVVFVAAAVESPGRVKHRGRGDLVIGHPTRRDEVRRVSRWFEQAGVPCVVSGDVERALWLKLIINSMANATSALTGASYLALAEYEPTWKVGVAVAGEAVAVAAKLGVPLDLEDVLEKGRAVIVSVGSATSSTEQDIAHGRPTEIDSLNGYIARRGAEVGVPTPANDALHALVKLRERIGGRTAVTGNSRPE
jgi:2-dehydropantoate 2-reductase